MTVTVNHAKTNAITDWTQAQLDEQIALGNFAPGTTLANIVLPSDWNNNHTLTGLGTMAEQNANSVAITGGSVNGTTIGATTASTGRFTSVTTPSVTATTTDLTFNTLTTGKININDGQATGALASPLKIVYPNQYSGTAGATNKLDLYSNQYGLGLSVVGSTASLDLVAAGTTNTQVAMYTGNGVSAKQFQVSNTASAVNYVQVTGAATGTGNSPTISSQGSDTDINLTLAPKAAGLFRVTSGVGGSSRFSIDNGGVTNLGISGSGGSGFRVSPTTSQVNFYSVSGSIAGLVPVLTTGLSSDTNVSMAFQPKGTGAIDLAAGSSGVNISNGGTVTAVTRTNTGAGYTSFPTVTVSPPTTAGGVQAVVAVSAMGSTTATIASGGTGYTVGNTLTVASGTGSTFTVSSVSSGVVTGITTTGNGGSYSTIPTNPVATTGGTGTGCTLNLSSYYVISIGTITNAGSGYIEQPTITFSGGGGSGAAAYATVGSTTVIKTLGSVANSSGFSFQTPAGEQLRISDAGNTSVNYLAMWGNATGAAPRFVARGSDTDVSLIYSTKGAGTHTFRTNDTNQTQFQISHTASAVNYVQVTGGATGVGTIISTQGSDANATFLIRSKGTSAISLQSGAGATTFEAVPVTSSVNFLRATPAIAGSAPILSAIGSDTNIDLALTPKGTGVVTFGTYTASILTPTGYIEIKDSGGTVRRLLVG